MKPLTQANTSSFWPKKKRSLIPYFAISCAFTLPTFVNAEDKEQKLEAVEVTATHDPSGFAADTATVGPLGNKKLLDVPYSINVLTSDVIQNQQASSLADLLKYLPSAQMEARGGMDVGRPQTRGMQSDVVANNHLNGLNVVGTTAYPMEMMERVEVINGLVGALYGPANPAGSFNFVQKRSTDAPVRNFTLGYSGKDTILFHADVGGRAGPNGVFGYRFNLLNEEGDGYVKGSHIHRKLASGALDFKISRDTTVELNASHYTFDKYGFPGSFSYSPTQQLPDAPDPTRPGYGQPFTGMALETNTVSARINHALNENWKLTAAIGRQIADRGLTSVTNTLVGSNGAYNSTASSSVPGRFVVNSNELRLNGKVKTGSAYHDLVLGTNGYEWVIQSAINSTTYPLGSASFNNPAIYPEVAFNKSGERATGSVNRQQSFIFGDTITFNRQWSAMLVGTYGRVSTRNYNRSSYVEDTGFSGTASVTYKPSENIATYIAYANSLQQGSTSPTTGTTINKGETLAPHRSKQVEVGAKYDMAGLMLGAALFRLERPLAYTGTDNIFREQGNQRNNGLELTLAGNVTRNLSLYGGVTFLDAKMQDTVIAANNGNRVVGVPRVQSSVLAEYRLNAIPDLTLSSNIHYTGSREINDANTAKVDGYTTLDLGARYVTKLSGQRTTWRLAVNNVTNENYWVSIFPGNINGTGSGGSAFLGTPRELRASVSMSF